MKPGIMTTALLQKIGVKNASGYNETLLGVTFYWDTLRLRNNEWRKRGRRTVRQKATQNAFT